MPVASSAALTPRAAANRELWRACAASDPTAVRAALAAGANPSARRGTWSVLGRALRSPAETGLAVARCLLEAGAKPIESGLIDQLLRRPLSPESDPVLRLLLKNGAKPLLEDVKEACRVGRADALTCLLEGGAPVLRAEEGRLVEHALADWDEKRWGSSPASLVHAARSVPVSNGGLLRVWGDLARVRGTGLWRAYCADAACLRAWGPDMAAAAVEADWRDGFEAVVAADPTVPFRESKNRLVSCYPGSVVACAVSLLSQWHRQRPRAEEERLLAFLDRILRLGFSPRLGATTTRGNAWTYVPVLFHAVKLHQGSPRRLQKLLQRLIAAGADPTEVWRSSKESPELTLAYPLLEHGNVATWRFLRRHHPAAFALDSAPSLLHWALANFTGHPRALPCDVFVGELLDEGVPVMGPDNDPTAVLTAFSEGLYHLDSKNRDPKREAIDEAATERALVRLLMAGASAQGGSASEVLGRLATRRPELVGRWETILAAHALNQDMRAEMPSGRDSSPSSGARHRM